MMIESFHTQKGGMDTAMKKISIIIPCYNAEAYIDRCLASIAGQTMGMDSLEVICVDDASTDHTWECLQAWEQRFPEDILLIRQEVNRRQGTAQNTGLGVSSADWVAFVDADDWLEPDYFERLYEPVGRYECDVISCGWARDSSDMLTCFDPKRRREGTDGRGQYIRVDTKETRKQLFRFRKLGEAAWGKIIRKDLLREHQICFPEGLAYEDHYWTMLLYIYVSGAYVVGENLYHYYENPRSTTVSKNNDFHIDLFTIQLRKWTDYGRRGILEEYPEECMHDALRDAWQFLAQVITQYDQPSYSLFQLQRELIMEHIPDYREDPYLADFPQIARLFLSTLYLPMSREEFQQIADQMRSHWY